MIGNSLEQIVTSLVVAAAHGFFPQPETALEK